MLVRLKPKAWVWVSRFGDGGTEGPKQAGRQECGAESQGGCGALLERRVGGKGAGRSRRALWVTCTPVGFGLLAGKLWRTLEGS